MVHGEPPELPECKSLLVQIWHVSGDDLEAIAERTGYKGGYVRRMFNGSVRISAEFMSAAAASYPGLIEGE